METFPHTESQFLLSVLNNPVEYMNSQDKTLHKIIDLLISYFLEFMCMWNKDTN